MSSSPTATSRSRLEFRTTLRWRLIIICVVAIADVAMTFARSGELFSVMLPWYATYGCVIGVLFALHAYYGEASSDWLFPLSLCLDLIVVAVIQHRGGSAFWHGPTFYALAVLVASAVLRPGGVVAVTVAAIGVFATKTYLESAGIWGWERVSAPTRAFFGTPGYALDHVLLGTVALIAVALIQRRLVRRIQIAEAEQRAIVDASPDLLVTFNLNGVLLSANAAATAALGKAAKPGTPFDLLHVALNSHENTRRAFMSASRGEPETIHASLNLETGGTRHLSITFAPVLDDGVVSAVLTSGRDVTDERNAIADREELHRQLEESRRMQLVGRLVSGVAHELNNPLSAILNHAELLRDGRSTSGAELHDGLDIIRGEARRAREIVRDLLQVARADSHRLRSEVSVERLVTDVAAALRPLASLNEVALSCRIEGNIPAVVLDATGISQVLTNLVMNAIDACGARGNVSVTASAEDDSVRIVVEDDGPGIATTVQAHLFEPFVTTKAPGNGTGLGLAVSLGIVEQHRGRLLVEDVWPDRERRGARFTIVLPRAVASTQTELLAGEPEDSSHTNDPMALDVFSMPTTSEPNGVAQVAAPESQKTEAPGQTIDPTRQRRVLVVEDEPAIRAALHRWFTREGWIVRTVADGIDALEALRLFELEGESVDAIICDLRMPRMGGPEFYQVLEQQAPELAQRIIFSTGDIVSQDVHAFLTSVDVPVLEKPFEFRALAAKLADLDASDRAIGRSLK